METIDKTFWAPGEGKRLEIVGDPFICKATGENTGNVWALFEATVLPGSLVPEHKHAGFDEAFYILEGELEMSMEGKTVTAAAGCFVNIPRGTPHSYQNTSSQAVRYLTWTHPAGIEHFYEEIDQQVKALPQDIEKVLAIAERHQIEIMLPADHYSDFRLNE
jgi:quercetin dioxygenase-like cupin family protein